MRNRTTYIILGIVLLAAAAIVWQRYQGIQHRQNIEQRTIGLAITDPQAIDRITIRNATTTELVRQENAWRIASSENILAASSYIDTVMNAAQEWKVISVAADAKTADLESLALSESQRTTLTLQANGETVLELWLGRPEDYLGIAYAQLPNTPTIYLLKTVPVDIFSRTDWRDKSIFRFGATEVKTIKYENGKKIFTLSRADDGSWDIDGKLAKADAAELFAGNLGNLNAVEFLPAETDFKPSGIKVTITLKTKTLELALGQTTPDDSTYLKTGDGKLYLIANTNRNRLTKERKEFLP